MRDMRPRLTRRTTDLHVGCTGEPVSQLRRALYVKMQARARCMDPRSTVGHGREATSLARGTRRGRKRGIPMYAPDEHTAFWRSVVMGRLITPWEYRHRRAVAGMRCAAGGFHLGIGVVLLSLGQRAGTDRERRTCYRWAA